VTTRTLPSPGWRSAIRRSARRIRSWCASVDSPTNSTRSRSTAVSPSQFSPVFLAQVRVEHDREAQPLTDNLRRLAGADEVARVDRLEPLAGELVGELPRLPAAEIGQGPIGVPL
jgi:hypothetical protein